MELADRKREAAGPGLGNRCTLCASNIIAYTQEGTSWSRGAWTSVWTSSVVVS